MCPVDILNMQRVDGLTPLHMAAKFGNLEVLAALLRKGALVDTKSNPDDGGCTALQISCQVGRSACAKLLVEAGASSSLLSAEEFTAEDYARNNGHFQLARFLMNPTRRYNLTLAAQLTCSTLAGVLRNITVKSVGKNVQQENFGLDLETREPAPGPLEIGECSICGDETKLMSLSRCKHS